MDDFALFGEDKEELWAIREELEEYFQALRLRIHPHKCHVLPVRAGTEFLGFRLFPSHRLPLKRKARQFFRHLKKLREEYAKGLIPLDRVRQSVQSWLGHVSFGQSYRLRENVLSQVTFVRGTG